MLKTLFYSLFISLIFISNSFSQKIITGTVLSSSLKDTLSFVNIGITNKNIGTVSSDKGNFELKLDKEYLKDSLKFSMIGFKSKVIPIVDFINHKTILLEEKIIELEEIILDNKKYKLKILGNEKPKSLMASLSFSKIDAGNEIGIKIKINKPTIIETFNMVIVKNEYGKLNLRINFYDLKKGKPNKRINKENIIIIAEVKNGLITADLSKYDLLFKNDIFVSVESLNKLDADKKIIFAGKVLKKSFARKTSQASWEKVKVGFCIFLNAKQA